MEAPMQVNVPYYLSPWRKPLTIKTSFGYSYGSEVRGVGGEGTFQGAWFTAGMP